MSDRKPLMPKATASWLVENTALSFEQIADFCQMHLLEVKGIADGDVAAGIKGMDPISSGQLSREEIQRGERNPAYRLKLAEPKFEMPQVKSKRSPRYTPVSRRHERPNAVLWLLRNHPELKDSQIMRLVGTTKPTILQIRDRSHWNAPNLQPQDPVTMGLCSQVDLDAEVQKSAERAAKDRAARGLPELAGTLLSATDTTGYNPTADADEPTADADDGVSEKEQEALMLQSLKSLKGEEGNEDDEAEGENAEAEDEVSDDDEDDEDGDKRRRKR